MYYTTCPYCGANLDPNEVCDCQENDKREEASSCGAEGQQMTVSNLIKILQNMDENAKVFIPRSMGVEYKHFKECDTKEVCILCEGTMVVLGLQEGEM